MSLELAPTPTGANQPDHLLLLYQRGNERTYHSVPDETALCHLVLQLCEEDLVRRRGIGDGLASKTDGPADPRKVLQYDAADLLNFLDAHIKEVVVLKYCTADGRYDPEGRDWLKNRLYQWLLVEASGQTTAPGSPESP